MERRLYHIYEALDVQNYKLAIQLANKILKKTNVPAVKVKDLDLGPQGTCTRQDWID